MHDWSSEFGWIYLQNGRQFSVLHQIGTQWISINTHVIFYCHWSSLTCPTTLIFYFNETSLKQSLSGFLSYWDMVIFYTTNTSVIKFIPILCRYGKFLLCVNLNHIPDSKVHDLGRSHLGPLGPRWAHVGSTSLAIRDTLSSSYLDMAIFYFMNTSAMKFILILFRHGHFILHRHFSHEVYPYPI